MLRQNSRLGRRISRWLTYLLAASVISIVPSALWLPASPANASTAATASQTQVDVGSAGGTGGGTNNEPASCAYINSYAMFGMWGSSGNTSYMTALGYSCAQVHTDGTTGVSGGEIVFTNGGSMNSTAPSGGECASGSVITSITIYTNGTNGSSGVYAEGFTFTCTTFPGTGTSTTSSKYGYTSGGSSVTLTCASGSYATGLYGRFGAGTDQIGLYCMAFSNFPQTSTVSITNSTTTNSTSTTVSLTASGGNGSGAYTFSVSNGTSTTCSYNSSNSTLSSSGVGTCLVTAARSADSVYAASGNSAQVTFTFTATLSPPTSISANPVSNNTTSATVSFTADSHAASTTLRIWTASSGGTQFGSDWTNFSSGGTVTGLSAGTTYYAGLTSVGSGNYNSSSESTRVAFTTNPAANTPTISVQPSNLSKTSPQSASLSVTATGNGTLSYQWQVNPGGTGSFSNVTYGTGGTSSTYNLDPAHYANNDQYKVTITNSLNGTTANVTSNIATLTLASALSITTPSTGLSATAGTPYSLSFTGNSLVSGGKTPYTFNTSGSLPTGVTLTNSTNGVLSGTPTTVGTYSESMTVTDSNSQSVSTNAFTINVTAGPKSNLYKTQVISSSTPSGATITTQPKFTLQDAYGNTASGDSTAVVAAIYSNNGGTLNGTKSVTPVSGVATFTDLSLDGTNNTQYVLSFTCGSIVAYETLTVTTGAATKLVLANTSNSPTVAGAALNPQPIVYVEDSGGNVVSDSGAVSVSITSGYSGNLGGTTTINAVAGTATYAGLSLTGIVNTAYVLTFSRSGLSSTSETLRVSPGPTANMVLSTVAAGTPNGISFLQQPVLTLSDANSNPETGVTDTVTATISSGATLVGTTVVNTVNGVATFSNLGVRGIAGTAYTLTYTDSIANLTVTQNRIVPGSAIDTALTFDGSTTYENTDFLNISQLSLSTFTNEVWVKPSSNTCLTEEHVWERNGTTSTPSDFSWMLLCYAGNWSAQYYDQNSGQWGSLQLGPVELNQWQHLAFTYDSSSRTFIGYFNGTATIQTTLSSTTTISTNQAKLYIGGNFSGTYDFSGQIDEFRYWDSVRSGTQIATDMNTWMNPAQSSTLAVYYDFNDVVGSVQYSKAPATNALYDLTLHGTTTSQDLRTAQSCSTGGHTCISFSRSYLNPFGGWKVPTLATSASVLVVAGGGGGSAQTDKTGYVGGGGGAGGYQFFGNTSLVAGSYVPIIVGAAGYGGGAFSTGWGLGLSGTNSQFGSLAQSVGGGAGGGKSLANTGTVNGVSGGSGGGGGSYYSGTGGVGGGSTSGQGNVGGNAASAFFGSGGGGGAGGAGADPTAVSPPALGGSGVVNPVYGGAFLAAGGNGAGGTSASYYTNSTSSYGSTPTGSDATANSGSGGGGGGGGTSAIAAGAGGTGLIAVEYINALPVVADPSNVTSTASATATFLDTNTVPSGVTRTYTWQVSTDNGSTWNTAPNGVATNGTMSGSAGLGQVRSDGSYVTPTLTYSMNSYQYRVIAVDSDTNGLTETTTTAAAILTVNRAIAAPAYPGTATYGIRNNSNSAGYIQVSSGTGTGPFTFSAPASSLYVLDTSTASSGYVYLYVTGLPVGVQNVSVTVTDSVGATYTNTIATTVSQASATTTFTSGAAFYNQPDTLTATVSSASLLAVTGTVTFKDASNNTLCTTGSLNASGQASCAWTPATTNPYLITAYFTDGAGNYASSQSLSSSVTPGKASITMSVSATAAVVAGASNALTLTATLNPTGSVAPGGTVAFTVNGISACSSASVSSSTATCTYTALSAGVQTVSAVYSGDGTFNGANASTTTSVSSCSETVTGNTYLTGAPGGGYCAVEFTSGSGTWTIPTGVTNAQILIVGGGGAGGERAGGGGGAGELLYTNTGTALTLTGLSATISVGAGGAIETNGNRGSAGGTSSFGFGGTTYSASGGGFAGAGGAGTSGTCGSTGGSSGGEDGGSGYCTPLPTGSYVAAYPGFTYAVHNGAYGTDNSAGVGPANWSGGGGGGSGGDATSGTTTSTPSGRSPNYKYTTAGNGGAGTTVAIALNTASACYAAGGGGGVDSNSTLNDLGNVAGAGGGCGSTIIGGAGSAGGANYISSTTYSNGAGDGAANTGSGGGGSGFNDSLTGLNYVNGKAGKGGSGVVIVKYLSPSIIVTNLDAVNDSMTVNSGTSITLTETATVFNFSRTTQWQVSVNGGTSWALETATATAGANSSSGNSSPTLSYTFVIRCGLNTGGVCLSSSALYLFRAAVIDTDTATNLVTASYSPTITVTVKALSIPTPLILSTTSAIYIPGNPFTLATTGGAGSGTISYTFNSGGTASGCSVTGAALRVTSAGTCSITPVQAADLDYQVDTGTATTVSFYIFTSYVNQYVAPVGTHGIGGGVSGGGINNVQTTGSTVLTVTGMTPTTGIAGTTIVLTGTNFETGTVSNIVTISFNSGLDLVPFVINSPTQVTLTLPAGEAGVVDQFVIQPVNGTSVLTQTFTGL